jgi:ketosteroid isomerase-like protein
MRSRVTRVFLSILLTASLAAAQTHAAKKSAASKKSSGTLTAAYLEKVMDAWSTMDTKNVTRYYSQAADNPYFDVTPMQWPNWEAYAKGVQQEFGDYKQFKITLSNVRIHNAGNFAWSTATWHANTVDKNGKAGTVDARWTAIWQKQGGRWIILHDHNSIPGPAE